MMLFRILALLLAWQTCLVAADAKRPNILWLFADDHAFQAIGAYGGRFSDLDLTPNIDRIAEIGRASCRERV